VVPLRRCNAASRGHLQSGVADQPQRDAT